MIMNSKLILGFNVVDIDYIRLDRGFVKQSTNLIGLTSESNVFEEVFKNGSDKDFNLLLENLLTLSKEEKEYWISYILTAQNGWTERDSLVIENLYTSDLDLFKIVKTSFQILIFNSEKSYRSKKRKERLRDRKTNLIKAKKDITLTRDSVFKEEIDVMLNYLEMSIKDDASIYLEYRNKTTQEILKSRLIKDFAEINYK